MPDPAADPQPKPDDPLLSVRQKFDKQLAFLGMTLGGDPDDDSRRDALRVSEALSRTVRSTAGWNPWPAFRAAVDGGDERAQRSLTLYAFNGLAEAMRERVSPLDLDADGPDVIPRKVSAADFGAPDLPGYENGSKFLTGTVTADGQVEIPGLGTIPFPPAAGMPPGAKIAVQFPADLGDKLDAAREGGAEPPAWLAKLGAMADGVTGGLGGDPDPAGPAMPPFLKRCPDCGTFHENPTDHHDRPAVDTGTITARLGDYFSAVARHAALAVDHPEADVSREDARAFIRDCLDKVNEAGRAVVGLAEEDAAEVWEAVARSCHPRTVRHLLTSFLALQKGIYQTFLYGRPFAGPDENGGDGDEE